MECHSEVQGHAVHELRLQEKDFVASATMDEETLQNAHA